MGVICKDSLITVVFISFQVFYFSFPIYSLFFE